MLKGIKEKMNWERLHHMYLGLLGGILCLGGAGVSMGWRSLPSIEYFISGAIVSLLWALDDVLYHNRGWKTPCWYVEQFLRKFKWWRALEEFINKLIGGKPDER